jgi:hypothetical protein
MSEGYMYLREVKSKEVLAVEEKPLDI